VDDAAERKTEGQLGREFAAQFRPRPLIYWADLIASAGCGWGLFAVALWVDSPLPYAAAILGSSIALLRATYFIHEIAHINPRHLPGFTVGWSLVAGIPMLVAPLMIGAHKYHHRVSTYGTDLDPEYATIARWSRLRFVVDLLTMTLVPVMLIARWAIIAPLSWLLPPLRKLVVERMSTLATNPTYQRTDVTAQERRRWVLQELPLCGFVWVVAVAIWVGMISVNLFFQWWLVTGVALVLNEIRTYVAHAYELGDEPTDMAGQVRDTLTLDGIFLLTDALAPLGDRFHAAHHRYPSLPYHALPAVHRRLLKELPPGHVYRTTQRNGLSGALLMMWKRSRRRGNTRVLQDES